MDFKSFLCAVLGAFQTLTAGWSVKTFFAALLALLLHKHAVLFYGFAFLVFLDCVTKWTEISYQRLCERGENPTLIKAFLAIDAARKQGSISSEVMKHRFIGKIIAYLLCASAAGVFDLIVRELAAPQWAVSLVIGYLSATELLSIAENLSGAGCANISGLVTAIKKRL